MSRIRWWPVGHHLFPANTSLTLEIQMTFQQTLDLAEIEADCVQSLWDSVIEDDLHPVYLNQLSAEATLARHRYYDALNADLAL